MLLPEPVEDVDDDALRALYAVPAGTPWLRANMVSSLDGAVSVEGRSGGLSSPADKRVFALLRDLCDAVLVGAGTARAEGYGAVPRSGARVARRRALGLADLPTVAVVSSSLDLDPGSRLFAGGGGARTVLVTTQAAARERGGRFDADLVTTPGERVDLPAAVAALRARGHAHLLCEGGPHLLGQVAGAGLLDELCLTLSPVLAAGDAPRALTGAALAPPVPARLGSLLEEDGVLLSRWRVR
ncbi:pyrimidine reductase family protein [Vallicoccus soli]|uniref:Pyrimidine reductase family protein n=1 Tax=Vallicoccus soli TaxID=2339232 RepID=A0A3A3YP82_9ACTN|nr:pyrimidine reductase family protein [Vallicoccus soli]RJK92990.1 pyrimidine reductase family protein [Vallicoccus soli]